MHHSSRNRPITLLNLSPQVAEPHNVDLGVDVSKVAGTKIDQVFIGSCTNGRFEDFAEVAEVLGDRKFSDNVRVIIIPASRQEYLKTLRAGLIERFVMAGALVEAPCCGPCMGGAFGLLAPGKSRSLHRTVILKAAREIPGHRYICVHLRRQQRVGFLEKLPIHERCNHESMEIWRQYRYRCNRPGRFLTIYDPEELAKHAFEGIRDEFAEGSENRGCHCCRKKFWMRIIAGTCTYCIERGGNHYGHCRIICPDFLPECNQCRAASQSYAWKRGRLLKGITSWWI